MGLVRPGCLVGPGPTLTIPSAGCSSLAHPLAVVMVVCGGVSREQRKHPWCEKEKRKILISERRARRDGWVCCKSGILPRSHAAPFDGWSAPGCDARGRGEGGVKQQVSKVRRGVVGAAPGKVPELGVDLDR